MTMDYEKKYKEALEKARQLCAYPTTKPFISDLQDLFPELKEENGDERIKEDIITYLSTVEDKELIPYESWIAWLEKQGQKETAWNNEYDKDMLGAMEYCIKNNRPLEKEHIAWLEKHGKSNPYSGVSFEYNGNVWGMCARDNGVDIILNRELIQHISIEQQGEQKSKNESTDTCDSLIIKSKGFPASEKRDFGYFSEAADKVESKFKVGDWVVDAIDTVYQIKEIKEDRYLLQFYNSNDVIPVKISTIDNDCHLWTVQDAKDGDVLSNGKMIVIFKYFEEPSYRQHIVAYIGLDNYGDIQITNDTWNLGIDKAKPATKEQRDTLMKAMADAGYTFDFEKKELNKIESDLTEFENTLADVCRGWIGEELGWKDYIIKNSLPLLELAKKQFDEYEQKPDNKVAPKFKVGDWITNGDYTWKIVEVKPLDYILQSQDGNIVDDTISHVDEQFHSFTIEDAKDGDVLFEDKISSQPSPFIAIFKKKDSVNTFSSHCFIGFDGKFYEGEDEHDSENLHPATKEQRDTLFAKMKEAGYEWDAEKKKLEKIEDKLKSILFHIEDVENKDVIDWLKSLKDRYTWKPSEEQMIALHQVISGCSYDIEPLVELETKLKEL